MKNLKKRAMAGLLVAAFAVCTFANVTPANAKTLTAKQYLVKMEKKLEQVKSYENTQTTIIQASAQGQTVRQKTSAKQIVFAKPLKLKTTQTMTVEADGAASSSKAVAYMKQNAKGKISMYTSVDGAAYEKTVLDDYDEDALDMDVDDYANVKLVKKNVKLNGCNTVQISAQIKGSDMEELLEALGMDEEAGEELGVSYETLKPINVTLWVDKKTYLPVKQKTEMKAFINSYVRAIYEAMGVEPDTDYTKVVSTVTYKNFNQATKFTLPKECR